MPISSPRSSPPSGFRTVPELVPPQTVSVWVDGALVADRRELLRTRRDSIESRATFVGVDAPPGVAEGDLVEVRVLTEPTLASMRIYDEDDQVFGARLLEPFFKPGRTGD